MSEVITKDPYAVQRNAARDRFAATGRTYADLTEDDLRSLRDLISAEMKGAKLMKGSFEMNGRIKFVDWPKGWAALTCRAYYFESREAVTFNDGGFIGFAGWADEENVKPILAGFLKWCDTLTTSGKPGDQQ